MYLKTAVLALNLWSLTTERLLPLKEADKELREARIHCVDGDV